MTALKLRLLAATLVACAALSSRFSLASDWPQWRGPGRNGISSETGLLKDWPAGGPQLRWKATDIGEGYSTPSVADGRVFLISDRDGDEFAIAFDEKTGAQVWSVKIGKVGANQGPQYPGSRCTPTVDGDNLYVLSSNGELSCLKAADGSSVWQKQIETEFEGKRGNWAYSESPLVDGDLLICTPGGARATLLALNKRTGAVVWQAASPEADLAAYSSPIAVEVDGGRQYIQFLHKGLVGVDAKTGKFLWRYNKTIDVAANIPTPIFADNMVFSATGRQGGGGVAKLSGQGDAAKADEVWHSTDVRNGIGGAVLLDGRLYGGNGQTLTCVEFATGKVLWNERGVGDGGVCYADGRLYVRAIKGGGVALVEPSPEGYKEHGRFTQPDLSGKDNWQHPLVANGGLYLRDQGSLFCYDVKDPAASEK